MQVGPIGQAGLAVAVGGPNWLGHAQLITHCLFQLIDTACAIVDLDHRPQQGQPTGVVAVVRAPGVEQVVGVDMLACRPMLRTPQIAGRPHPVGRVAIDSLVAGNDGRQRFGNQRPAYQRARQCRQDIRHGVIKGCAQIIARGITLLGHRGQQQGQRVAAQMIKAGIEHAVRSALVETTLLDRRGKALDIRWRQRKHGGTEGLRTLFADLAGRVHTVGFGKATRAPAACARVTRQHRRHGRAFGAAGDDALGIGVDQPPLLMQEVRFLTHAERRPARVLVGVFVIGPWRHIANGWRGRLALVELDESGLVRPAGRDGAAGFVVAGLGIAADQRDVPERRGIGITRVEERLA